MKIFSYILIIAVIFSSCKSEKKIMSDNEREIENYLVGINETATVTSSGLNYIITEEGDGEFPSISDEVTVNYTGYFTNGDIFDMSTDPITFPLTNVIEGWQEGIPLLSRGGSGKLIIPSHLGYGSNPPNGIPENAVLIFDVDLIDF